MKKYILALVVFAALMGNCFADDAADLQKLQPLTKPEQTMYEGIKNNFSELHKFIATRTYLHTLCAIEPKLDVLVEEAATKPIKTTMFPKMPDGVAMDYAVDLNEQLIIARITWCQGSDAEGRRLLQCD
jgi:hypothetical protein